MDSSFEAIVEQYRKMVYGIALTYTGNKTDADDVFQDTFLTCYQKLDILKDMEHCRAWLIRTAINISKRYVGSTWKKKVFLFGDDSREAGYMFESDEEKEVFIVLKKLPEKYKVVIYLFYIEEMKISEIALCLGISISAVKVRLNRGRKIMRNRLGGNFDE